MKKTEELIDELKVRLNTEPRKYEKQDYAVLVEILYELLNSILINKFSNEETDDRVTALKAEVDQIVNLSFIRWEDEPNDI